LKEGHNPGALTESQQSALTSLRHQDFSLSDQIMSRCISTAIQLSWTPEQLAEKGKQMVALVQAVLASQAATADA